MLKQMIFWVGWGLVLLLVLCITAGAGYAQLKSGQAAPLFVLKDTKGISFDLTGMKDQPMLILYFFDVASRPNQEGLLYLDQLAKKYKHADLKVWGVTRSTKTQVVQFLSQSKLGFTILIDNDKVFDQYSARLILPTICILGPDLKLLDYFQGGGKNMENMLVKLAERKLQHRQTEVAKAITQEVTKKNPQNTQAQTVKGYAELKEGNLKAAENTFYNLARSKGEAEILGKEGLSQVYARKGEPAKAMDIAEEVEKKAGQRAYTHVVKGDLLYSEDKPKEAEAEYRKAAGKTAGAPTHRAVAYNQLGRIYAVRGKYTQSREMYDQAVALDPYFVEATSNKGMAYEKEGQWAKALEVYRRAQAIDSNDPFAAALAFHAEKMLLLQKDPDKRSEFEKHVLSYVNRYQNQSEVPIQSSQDGWTSSPTVMVFFEPLETGGLAVRDGFARVLTLQLTNQLNSSGRVRVIDPVVVEKVMKKLKLTRKDLIKPETVAHLAKAFGANLIGKGNLFHLSDSTLLNLKLTETSSMHIVETVKRQFASAVTLKKDLYWLNREILNTLIVQYPLQAYVVEVTGNQVLINIGADQGVVMGAHFDVIEQKSAIEYKGKQFQPEPSVFATVEVVRVDADFSYAHIKEQRRPVNPDDKLRESAADMDVELPKVW